MKERPILFSGAMVRAILAGEKMQTRRVVKPQPHAGCGLITVGLYTPTVVRRCFEEPGPEVFGAYSSDGEWGQVCPYGVVGDRLWVRETHGLLTGNGHRIVYRADADPPMTCGGTEPVRGMKWNPSIFMRRQHSRITLEVTDVRVERLQEISGPDAIREGCEQKQSVDQIQRMLARPQIVHHELARNAFQTLWQSINAKRAPWDSNPWVWVISFKRIQEQRAAA